MVSARHRFGLVQYSGTKDFNHEQIARFALDELYLAAATRALHRWRAPVTATTSDSHLLWGLFNLVAVAGTDGAVNALVSVWSNAAPDLRELMLRPRLAKAAKLAPARDTIARIASEPLESRPLPFSPTESMAADLPTHQPSSAKRIDPNLHLAIVHAMIGAGQVPAPPPAMTKGQGSATRKALLAMPVPANFLTSLTSLSWTAGPIQTTIDPSWGGETDAFHLADLKHITSLVALESLHLELMHPTIDLEPLRALSSLKQINITVPVADVQALRDLPNLVDLQVTADDADENLAVLASLRDRGVTIRCP